VGGRLRNATVSFDFRHPIILHARDRYIELLIHHLHNKYFHAGKSFLIKLLMQQFYIVGGISEAVKRIVRRCPTCLRYAARSNDQIMGQLPELRTTLARPFARTGIDFFGPLEVKCTKHRTTRYDKTYGIVFVCFSTRALHIEVCSDLSTAAFIAALRRFAARRSMPSEIFTDNATNFQGARAIIEASNAAIRDFVNEYRVRWNFITPRAPHQGGLWEAAVKSAKFHLRRVIRGSILTYEEYHTLCTQIEAILNSRPLCYIREGDDQVLALTPHHLITRCPLITLSTEDDRTLTNLPPVDRWKRIQHLLHSFWLQWRSTYLEQVRVASRWLLRRENLEVGDVVILRDELSKPGAWPLGVIESTYPDSLGVVRNVDIRTTKGVYR